MDEQRLHDLAALLEGTLHWDRVSKALFATDASVYREVPLAVCFPKGAGDIQALIRFANQHHIPLIPRAGGTSLAGQAIGRGIVVDVSKHMTHIEAVDPQARTVWVQPGVIRDVLNQHLKPYGLFFAPETSTANRATIGGMVGNNSCGSNSIRYGTTSDYVLALKGVLSDGSAVVFQPLTPEELDRKTRQEKTLEREIYRHLKEIVHDPEIRKEVAKEYPHPSIPRRNTGYAIDRVIAAFETKNTLDVNQLLAGSEGTLAFTTAIKLRLVPLPPEHKLVVCGHFDSVYEALSANTIAVEYHPSASELIDAHILDCTEKNLIQRRNRSFILGKPRAVLAVEICETSPEVMRQKAQKLIAQWQSEKLGYGFPILQGADIAKLWSLRKAGLGLLANTPGDEKPVTVIEDTAVGVADLPEYIREIDALSNRLGLKCIHYAHAGSGEIHSRPMINLKTQSGKALFREIAHETAQIVKRYRGSLSGEHGDGRLRGSFIPFMLGEKNYRLLLSIKSVWDPKEILNPHKITKVKAMDGDLRFSEHQTEAFDTTLDFSSTGGFVRMAEQCNGAGDCRKTHVSGGVMCPSYMATRDEKDSTRGRANLLREIFTRENAPFESQEVKDILELCLSCKGCKSECNSNVDMSKLKSEFLYQYHRKKSRRWIDVLMGNFTLQARLFHRVSPLYNFIMSHRYTSPWVKYALGIHTKRSLPKLHSKTAHHWYKTHYTLPQKNVGVKTVFFFFDEFTNYNEPSIAIKSIRLLSELGYRVITERHSESGRSFLSKGMLDQAKRVARKNIRILYKYARQNIPIIGVEPSAILSFRDEYIDLSEDKEQAKKVAENTLTTEEFFSKEWELGNIDRNRFTKDSKEIWFHAHCYQKVLSSQEHHKKMLSIPQNYKAHMIPSGCCGMAGSFGYEKSKYDLSMKIARMSLIPTIEKVCESATICTSGTSCRHQVYDCLGITTQHPVEVLWDALIPK